MRKGLPIVSDAMFRPSMPVGEQPVSKGHLEPHFFFVSPRLSLRALFRLIGIGPCPNVGARLCRRFPYHSSLGAVPPLAKPEAGKVAPASCTSPRMGPERQFQTYPQTNVIVIQVPGRQILTVTARAAGIYYVQRREQLADISGVTLAAADGNDAQRGSNSLPQIPRIGRSEVDCSASRACGFHRMLNMPVERCLRICVTHGEQ